MFSLSTIATIGCRAFRQNLQKQVIKRTSQQHRLLSILIKPARNTRPAPPLPSATSMEADSFSTSIDHVVDGVMDKEFPGYFDKDHHRHHAPQAPFLDVHKLAEKAERSVVEDESLDPVDHDILTGPLKVSTHEVDKIVEKHHSVDECLTVDINVKELNAGEIPVAFAVLKSDALEYIDPDNKIHDRLLRSVKSVLGANYYQKHHELSRDVVDKLDDMLLHDKSIREDMIRDEIVQCVRDKFGPRTLVKIVFVEAIPRTASGKAMRGTLYKIGRGEPFTITKLIMDHEALQKIETEIKLLAGIDDNAQPQEAIC